LELDDRYHASSSYVNYKCNIPEVYLGLGMNLECRQFLKEYDTDGEYSSSRDVWVFTTILLNFMDNAHTTSDVAISVMAAKRILELLLEIEKVPDDEDGMSFFGNGSLTLSVAYVRSYGKYWYKTEGARKMLRAFYKQSCELKVQPRKTRDESLLASRLIGNNERIAKLLTVQNSRNKSRLIWANTKKFISSIITSRYFFLFIVTYISLYIYHSDILSIFK